MNAPADLAPDNKYIPVLDGLRAISILFVVVRHFEITTLVSANLGVTVFFFISGFIITRLMLLENERTGSLSVSLFYKRRIVRLVPALVVMVGIVVVLGLLVGVRIDWGQVFAGLFYYMNYYSIFLREAGDGYTLPINPLWSLAVEEHFYLVFPIVFSLVAGRIMGLVRFLVILIAVIFVWRLVNVFLLGFVPKYNYFATESRIETILFGCLLALISAHAALGQNRCRNFLLSVNSPTVLVLSAIGLMATLFIPGEEIRHTIRYTLQGVLIFLAVNTLLFSGNSFVGWARFALSTRGMVFLGRISYSLYLWHLPVAFFLAYLIDQDSTGFAWLALSISVLVASASYFWLERPIMAYYMPRLRRVEGVSR